MSLKIATKTIASRGEMNASSTARQGTAPTLRVDAQFRDLGRGVLELDLEDAVDRRFEAHVRGLAGLDVLLDVVPVDVDLLVLRGTDPEAHGLALVDAQLDDLAAGQDRAGV